MVENILKWVGGKSQSAEKIISMFPQHDCYVEVFFGGGSVFFRKKPSKVEIINDINSELVNFYRVLQNNSEEFKTREKLELYAADIYYSYRDDFFSGKHHTLPNVERAFRFFCLIKEAFGGTFGGGFGFSSAQNMATTFFNAFEKVDEITKRLKSVTIDNRDFEKIIKSYDGERTVFFTDPPYLASNNADYYFRSSNSSFGINDHMRLFLALKSIKGKCLLTVDDSVWIKERYTTQNGFYTINNEVFYSSAPSSSDSRKTVNELIITNYDPEKERKHIDTRQGTLTF